MAVEIVRRKRRRTSILITPNKDITIKLYDKLTPAMEKKQLDRMYKVAAIVIKMKLTTQYYGRSDGWGIKLTNRKKKEPIRIYWEDIE